MKKTLSVVLATFNEEKNLASCLDSIKDLADEIIIVDGTSQDKTVEIAKKYGAKVKITTNKPNFHINKQMAIDMATKDWILQLDADEHVGPELKEEIKQILENEPKEFNGYWMPRKNWFLGRFLIKGGQYPDYTLRFYKNGKGRLPQKDVHEQAVVEGKVGYLKAALLHYPYKSFKHYISKWNKYNDFFAQQIKEEHKNKNPLQKLFYAIGYLFIKPAHWFLTTYFRHKGFVDSWQGFVFSFFSALRFPASYIKYIGWYRFCSILILILAFTLRFYNFPNRWGLGGDDGRDAMVALEALKRHELPLIGPFSSAGPFVFGPIYYWIIMLSYVILPYIINSPWIILDALGVVSVAVLLYFGKILRGEKFSLVIGLLAATSPQLVIRSLMLGNPSFIPFFSIVLLAGFMLLWKKKHVIYAFLMGLSLGLALNMHYQAINLFIFFPAIFLITSLSIKDRIYSFLLMLFGFLIPSLPLLYWDMHQNFANVNNILDYLLIGQYRIYVPNSWSLFIFNYIPWYWAFLVGRFYLVVLPLEFLSILSFIYLFLRKKLKLDFIVLGFIFLLLLFVNRFYRGERSEGYLLYLAPFILIFTAFFVNLFFEFKKKYLKLVGVFILVVILFGNFITIKDSYGTNPVMLYESVSKYLSAEFPNKKFHLFDYKNESYSTSMGLSLILNFDGKEAQNGIPIGLSCFSNGCPSQRLIPIIHSQITLVDLYRIDKNALNNKKIWGRRNQADVYDDLIGWSKTYSLTSSFSLKKYIMERLGKL